MRNVHKLIDTRNMNMQSSASEINHVLIGECSKIFIAMKGFVSSKSLAQENEILGGIENLLTNCSQLSLETQTALRSVLVWSQSQQNKDLNEFRGFWGRGQQHILFERTEM